MVGFLVTQLRAGFWSSLDKKRERRGAADYGNPRDGFDDLRRALESFRGVRVHVVGDTIVDTYVFCSLTGGIAKTPTFSLKYEEQVDFAGGAAVVSKHMRKAGAEVKFSTVLGDDALKDFAPVTNLFFNIICVT